MSTSSSSSSCTVAAALFCCSDGYVHVGVLCCQGRYGDLIEKELSLIGTNGRVQLIDRLTPVVLLTQLLQNLRRSRSRNLDKWEWFRNKVESVSCSDSVVRNVRLVNV